GVQGGDLVGGADGQGPAATAALAVPAVLGGRRAGAQQHGHAGQGQQHGATSGSESGIEHGSLPGGSEGRRGGHGVVTVGTHVTRRTSDALQPSSPTARVSIPRSALFSAVTEP